MPVVGLPTTVETVINSLLQANDLSSYKIAGNPGVTTVVLRFGNMAGCGTAPSMVHTNSGNGSAPSLHLKDGAWSRKSPSQIKRDHRRQEYYFQPSNSFKSPLSTSHLTSATLPCISRESTTTPTDNDLFRHNLLHGPFSLGNYNPLSAKPKTSTVPAFEPDHSRVPHEHDMNPNLTDPSTFDSAINHHSPPSDKNTATQVTHSLSHSCIANISDVSTHSADQVCNTLSNDNINIASLADTTTILEDSGFVPEPMDLHDTELLHENGKQAQQCSQNQEQNQQQQQQQEQHQQHSESKRKADSSTQRQALCGRDTYPDFKTFVDFHDTDEFRNYVFDLDSGIQDNILDDNRNRRFRHVILDNFNGKKSIIVRTDDLVIECDLDKFKLHRWFAKDAAHKPYELMRLKHLTYFKLYDPNDIYDEASLAAICAEYILRLVKNILKPRLRRQSW